MKSVNEIRDELYQAIQSVDFSDRAVFQVIQQLFKDYKLAVTGLDFNSERTEHFEGWFQLHDLFCKKHDEFLKLKREVRADAATTVAPSVQSKAENAPANAAPGQLRLHSLLVKAPSNFQASARARKLHFIPPPHGSGQPAGHLFCHF